MKVKTSELTGQALDWAVAKCKGILGPDGVRLSDEYCDSLGHDQDGDFTTDWAQGGPIIERERISTCWEGTTWVATLLNKNRDATWYGHHYGPTPLVAAMRCYVASKLGDEVDVPDDLVWDELIYEKGDE